MFRFAILSVLLAMVAMPAFAQSDAERRARVERALDQLPEPADIEAAMDQVPNITGALTGLMAIANDAENQKTLEGLVGRLESEFSVIGEELSDGDIPDLNGMIEQLMLLSTDREFMSDALDLAFQVQDVMVEAMPEDAKP